MQAALQLQNNNFTGDVVALTVAEVEKYAKDMLKGRKKLLNRIKAAERRAAGKVPTVIRGRRLTQQEAVLAEHARLYVGANQDLMHVAKAENLFAKLAKEQADAGFAIDHAMLDTVAGIMTGSNPFGGEAVNWNGLAVTEQTAAELAGREAASLREEMELIDAALDDLESVDPIGALILRQQYVHGKKVPAVTLLLIERGHAEEGLAESTYHTWRKAALREFGALVGLC